MENLKTGDSITSFFEDNPLDFVSCSFRDLIKPVIQARKISSASMIKDSGINRRYYFDILSGKKNPSRNYVIRILLALKLTIQDAQWTLRAAGYSQLYVRNRRDAVIIYAFEHSISIKTCNEMLCNIEVELI